MSSALGQYVDAWQPDPVTDSDIIDPLPIAALSAVLDEPATVAGPGQPVPPLWHWLHFLEWPARSELASDGHTAHGHFMPPIPDRRRMFAGGRLVVPEPLEVGVPAQRVRELGEVTVKNGNTGEMVFVTVRSEISQDGRVRVIEEQDIVYRSGEDTGRSATQAIDTEGTPHSDEPWQLNLTPDPVLLFRFSALTANPHRIHYDHPYVTGVEGYPGLVVHGPLLVLLMLELPRRRGKFPFSLSYRLRRPVFAGEQVLALGEPAGNGAELRIATAREDRSCIADVHFGRNPQSS
jgi:3-methylfumaryl-CoA hydratase